MGRSISRGFRSEPADNLHYARHGVNVLGADKEAGTVADPVIVDRATGRELSESGFGFVAGPAANERTRRRMGLAARQNPTIEEAPPAFRRSQRRSSEVRHG